MIKQEQHQNGKKKLHLYRGKLNNKKENKINSKDKLNKDKKIFAEQNYNKKSKKKNCRL